MAGMEKSGFGVAHDFSGVKKEYSDFPILCETCLGDNPYVRMQRNREGKECRICTRPYTAFRWKPGPKARYKNTVICQTCAKLKNVCQTCLFDLQYGLPVQVRDKLMGEGKVELPDHPLNRDYMANRLEAAAEQLPYARLGNGDAASQLRALARSRPYYKRNAPRVCTFWQKGECNRGDECPYMHSDANHDPALANQNIRDRYTGQEDPVAEKILRLASSKPSAEELAPPADPTNTTLFVGGLSPEITEQDLRDSFYGFGELLSIKMYRRQGFAFLCYNERSSAEEAVKHYHGVLYVKGLRLRVAWSKPPEKRQPEQKEEAEAAQDGSATATTTILPPPFPGLPPLPVTVPLPFAPGAAANTSLPRFSAAAAGTAAATGTAATRVLPPPSVYGAGGAAAAYAAMNPKEAEYMKR
ncbi:UNVERIFIED_CONTAM: hypothetical protein H355_010018 [Colinus virginianus]|nr:hypothetical protein H355_010018 [Colinus virginianus]